MITKILPYFYFQKFHLFFSPNYVIIERTQLFALPGQCLYMCQVAHVHVLLLAILLWQLIFLRNSNENHVQPKIANKTPLRAPSSAGLVGPVGPVQQVQLGFYSGSLDSNVSQVLKYNVLTVFGMFNVSSGPTLVANLQVLQP